MNLKAYGKNAQKAVDDAKSEIERLDQLWSAVDKNSEIYQLNQKKKMKVSDETLELIEFAKKKSKESNDAFDISIVRPAAHVSNGLKSRIHPVVGRI